MNWKWLDSMNDEERRIQLPINIAGVIDDSPPLSSKSVFGAAHSGEVKEAEKKGKKLVSLHEYLSK